MEKAIEEAASMFLEKTKDREVKVISHHDTDGITSAAILTKTLIKLDRKFSVQIIKNLDQEFIEDLKGKIKNQVIVFLDLASSSLEELSKIETDIFVIDHHEISSEIPEKIVFINPHDFDKQQISGSGLTYLFSKSLVGKDHELANLAIIGMVGDMLGQNISKLNNKIIEDAELIIKKGLLLYPSTRPINKALEYSSIYIPGVTGNFKGVSGLLMDAGIKKEGKTHKSLIELSEEEMSNLITEIILRTKKQDAELIGNIYLVKFFNRLEDARELSAMINACSRLEESNISLNLCLNNKKARTKAEEIYASYKQHIVSALQFAEKNKIQGKGYVILNAKDKIKDTIIGTIASILSMSKQYEDGTIILTMAYDNDKIKVSTRVAGRTGRNVRELLSKVLEEFGGECGGHAMAAGCLIDKQDEERFLKQVKKTIELEVVKI